MFSRDPRDQLAVTLDNGQQIPLFLRLSPQAKRLTLRLDSRRHCLVLVHPRGVSKRDLMGFVHDQRDWISRHITSLPQRTPFAIGEMIPIEGIDHRIAHTQKPRGGAWTQDGTLYVSGDQAFLARRVQDYLRKRAEQTITPQALALAQRLDRKVGRISLRDGRSRWGSCTAKGDLSFSWRLIMAPPPVLTYVVAHEVAHLVELNHSDRFWAVVETLVGNHTAQRQWLKDQGSALHRFGPGQAIG